MFSHVDSQTNPRVVLEHGTGKRWEIFHIYKNHHTPFVTALVHEENGPRTAVFLPSVFPGQEGSGWLEVWPEGVPSLPDRKFFVRGIRDKSGSVQNRWVAKLV